MTLDDIYLVGCGTWLPPQTTAEEAIAAGHCDEQLVRSTGMRAVAVSDVDSAPDMAVRAARTALRRSGLPREDIHLLLHASVFYQGHEIWAPASYIQREALGNHCPAMEVRQASNGGLAAADLAVSYLMAAADRRAALVTTGDRCALPWFDRWRSDPGTVYADGATALVLSRGTGFARLRSLVTVSGPDLEGMHRGSDPFALAPCTNRPTVDLDACKRAFLAEVGLPSTVAQVAAGQRAALERSLHDAGMKLTDVARIVLPHLGQRRLRAAYFRQYDIDPRITTWPWSRHVGHLSAGDAFAGLEHLVVSGALGPGDCCLLVGAGAGYSWSCAVVEILEVPRWEANQ